MDFGPPQAGSRADGYLTSPRGRASCRGRSSTAAPRSWPSSHSGNVGSNRSSGDGTCGNRRADPAGNGSADAVTVAQAFHWFDAEVPAAGDPPDPAPERWAGAAVEQPLPGQPVNEAIDVIIAHIPQGGTARPCTLGVMPFNGASSWGTLEEQTFANAHALDGDGLAACVGSVSYIAALSPHQRQRVFAALRELTSDGPVTIRYVTEVYVADRRP